MSSIRRRLLVLLIVPLAAIAVIVSFETFYSARQTSNQLYDKTLLAAMLAVSENVVASNGTVLAEDTLRVLTDNLGDEFFYYVIGPGGAFVTGYSAYPRPPAGAELLQGVPIFYDGIYRGESVRVIALRQVLVGRELNGVTTITTWQKTTQRRDLTFSLFGISLVRLCALVLAAGVIVWFAVRRGLSPLLELQAAIDARTPIDLTPIRRAMPRELFGIVGSMNDLFARVARSKANRERFIGDAAHQLRNPIAVLKVQAELALKESGQESAKDGGAMRKSLRQIVDVSNQSSQLVNQMLTNARVGAMERELYQVFDLSATIRAAARDLAPKAIAKDQEFVITVPDGLRYKGERVLIREAVANLIDNAICYSPEGCEVSVIAQATGAQICIDICDGGAVIAPRDFARLCQPFYTEGGAAGSGLGLAIAKDVAINHGGALSVHPRKNGHGKVITMVLQK